MKRRPIVISLVAALLLLATTAMAQNVEIRLAHEEPGDATISSVHAAALVFKDVAETLSNGTMTVRIHPASSLGNQRDRMTQTQANVIQVNVASIGGLATFYPLINVVDLPFAFSSYSVFNEVFQGNFGDRIKRDMLDKTGFRLLSINAASFYVLSNNTRPIRTPADMRGIRFRTMAVPSHTAMMSALGAAATPVPWDELYSALQMGVVNGQHNPIPIMAIGGLQEVQRYASLTNHLVGADWWVTSDRFYQSLTADQKRVFNEAVYAAEQVANGTKILSNSTGQGVQFLEDAGVQVYAPTTAQLAQFRDSAVPAVMETIESSLGSDGTNLANAMLAAIRSVESQQQRSR